MVLSGCPFDSIKHYTGPMVAALEHSQEEQSSIVLHAYDSYWFQIFARQLLIQDKLRHWEIDFMYLGFSGAFVGPSLYFTFLIVFTLMLM